MRVETLADRVDGMIMTGFGGASADEVPIEIVAGFGGAILFRRNLTNAASTIDLTGRLQKAAQNRSGAPPLLAVDQEGGAVCPLSALGSRMPSAAALGAIGDAALTRSVYRMAGKELAALGLGFDFAPVADVNTNSRNPIIGTRSFGKDPDLVAEQVAAAVLGLHDAGVLACAKHFPGHGDTDVDSHLALPVVEYDLQRLRAIDLKPFRAAIAAGVDAIMTAHVAYPAVDSSGKPATLSRRLITDVLRGELGFKGLIITDALEMKAIAESLEIGEAAVAAVAAGVDLVATARGVEDAQQAAAALRAAILDGILDASQVEKSLNRIDALRRSGRPLGRPSEQLHEQAVDLKIRRYKELIAEHHDIMRGVTRKAIRILRDPRSLVPLHLDSAQKIFVVNFLLDAASAEPSGKQMTAFGKALARGPARVQEQLRAPDPAGHAYKQMLMAAGSADVIVAVTRAPAQHRLQAIAVTDLSQLGKPTIVVSAREPIDAAAIANGVTLLTGFGDDDTTMEALAGVLLGENVS